MRKVLSTITFFPYIFESSEIVEFNIEANISFNFSKIENEIKFGFFSCCLYKNLIYIHNNGKLYLYDYEKEEISMLKPRLFEPEAISFLTSKTPASSFKDFNTTLK